MGSADKLKLLLLRQFLYVFVLGLYIVFHLLGGLIGICLLMAVGRLTRKKDEALREGNVRLTQAHKHIYFGMGVIYFLFAAAVLILFCVVDPSRQTISVSCFFLAVLLVFVYAGAQFVYGPNSKI